MAEIETARYKFVLMFRRRLVNVANKLAELEKFAVNWDRIDIDICEMIKSAKDNIIKAYQRLPEK